MKNGSLSQKNKARQILGRCGEDRAAAFLVQNGFICLDRNWRCRGGEIDLIVEQGEEIRFIEVKTRKTLTYGRPEEAITARKLAHFRIAAEAWMAVQTLASQKRFQFDVITVFLPNTPQEQLVWIENVLS